MRGGSWAALLVVDGAKAVAEGAVLEARPLEGQPQPSCAVLVAHAGSSVALRRCELRTPQTSVPLHLQHPLRARRSLQLEEGAKATAAECTCGGRAVVAGRGSTLLHSGLAFPPGLVDAVVADDGGVARQLPASGPAGTRAG